MSALQDFGGCEMKKDGVFARIGGVVYRWNGWCGCQLESSEWRRVPAGTSRTLDFGVGRQAVDVTVWRTERFWPFLKVRTLWAVSASGDLNAHNARVHALKNLLKEMW